MRPVTLPLAAFGFAIAAVPAIADPIVNQINVAVDLTNIPAQAYAVQVDCDICTADCVAQSSPPAAVIYAGYGQQHLANGAFHGVVSVPITPLPQNGTGTPTDYACFLYVIDNTGKVTLGPAAPDWAKPMPGTPYTSMIKGTIADALAHPLAP